MRPTTFLIVILGFAPLLAAVGCRSATREVVITDDSAIRQDEARRIALRAQQEQLAGNKDAAIRLYREALTKSGDLYTVWNNLGLLLMERQEYMDAAEMFKSAAELAPRDPKPYYNAALLYDTAGHAQPAMEYYLKSLERDPRYLNALRGSARSARLLQMADQPGLERVRTGLLLERNPEWREFFEREQVRIEGQLAQERLMRTEIPGQRAPRMGELPAPPSMPAESAPIPTPIQDPANDPR